MTGPSRTPRTLMYPQSIHLHITTTGDRQTEEVFNKILKLLDAEGIKYNPALQYFNRQWDFLSAIELKTLRNEEVE